MNILSKYLRAFDNRNSAVFILSGQGSNAVSAFDIYRPLICSQNNPFYTPLPLNEYIDFLISEYDKYCENRRASFNPEMLKVIINMMALNSMAVNDIFPTSEELQNAIDTARSQENITESCAIHYRNIVRNGIDDFRNVKGFLSHYYSILNDILYPVIGNHAGYNTRILNSGFALQIKLKPMSASTTSESRNIEYNRTISRILHTDFYTNFNSSHLIQHNLIIVLDHLSYEQAELFAWLWNSDSSWLKHQEHVFIICLQEDYPKQMMRCTDFDGKIQKWYYLNHSDGRDLEDLLGESLVYNTSTNERIDYGGIISINRILKIPTGQGTHTVPAYRPRYSRTFFQELSPGEGLLKIRGQEKEHQFRCIRDS